MLHVSGLSKRFGENLLFEKAHFVINAGERVGLIGPNGCGKTTLLRILMGEEKPDAGAVRWAIPHERVGYLPQALQWAPGARVRDVLSGSTHLDEAHWAREVERLALEMAKAPASARQALEEAYAMALDRLGFAATFASEHLLERVLAGLGLADVAPETPVAILSGGQKTRLSLAKLLLSEPAFLILDEPTNHLDIGALEWLEGYLASYDGGMLLVSHDRAFLDYVVMRILEMDPQTHAVREYAGNYSAYAQAREREREKAWEAYQDQQERLARLEEAARRLKAQASGIEQETIHYHYRKVAKKLARKAVVQQKRLQRLIESEEHLEKPVQGWHLAIAFDQVPPSGQDVLIVEGLAKRFGERTLFEGVHLTLRQGERIVLIGPNGCGKTTLLRILMGLEPPSEGLVRWGANARVGYLAQDQASLVQGDTPLEVVRQVAAMTETEARTFLHRLLFSGDEVFTPIARLSFGERARLNVGLLMLRGCNVLLLDEPINYLDIPSRERFECALASFEGTVLAVVHDRYFIQRFGCAVWAFAHGTVRRFADLADARRGGAMVGTDEG